MELPLSTRYAIAAGLGITRRGGIEVVQNRVVRDGYDIKEVELALNIENLKKYLNTDEEDYETLWGMMVNKAEGRAPIIPVPEIIAPKVEIQVQGQVTDTTVDVSLAPIKKKGGRPKKVNPPIM